MNKDARWNCRGSWRTSRSADTGSWTESHVLANLCENYIVQSNTSCAKEDCKPERRHYFHQFMLMRNWLTNQMLLLRHLQMQPATPTPPRRLRCHAAQQPKRHHYESFAPGGLCHHLQSPKAVNLSLSQLQKQTGQWEISKTPDSPFGTVNSELSASDPMLLWPSPPENLRSRRLHWSVSHQTHNKGGLQRISVHAIQNCKISFNHHQRRALSTCPCGE